MKKQVFELNKDGTIKEYLLMSEEEIKESDKLIVTEGWLESFFEPKWDFEQKKWIEGLSIEEIQRRKDKIIEQENQPTKIEQLRQENEILAMAVMELSTIVLNGGK